MKVTLVLRIAAVMALLQGMAHGAIVLFGSAGRGPEESAVVALMKAQMLGNGGSHSYWDAYNGYALFAALTCLLEGFLFWSISGRGREVRPVMIVFLIGNIGYAFLVGRYFTARPPLVFDLAIAACLGLAATWA